MINHRISIVLITALALYMSFFLIPKPTEMALIYLRDKKFDKAYEIYQQELVEGNESHFVFLPLVELKLHYGNIKNATTLMEAFVEKNPASIEAWRVLAKYYQYGQRYQDYLVAVEKIASLQPSKENLQTLASIYNFNGQYEKQIATLHELIETQEAEASDYLALANLLSSTGDFSKAFGFLVQMQALFPNNFQDENLELALHLFSKLNKATDHEMLALAMSHYKHEPSVEKAVRIAELFVTLQKHSLAHEILQVDEKKFSKEETFYSMLMQVQLKQGQNDFVLQSLLKTASQGNISSENAQMLTHLLMENEDIDRLEQLLPGMDLKLFSEETILDLSSLAISYEKPKLASFVLDFYERENALLSDVSKSMLLMASKERSNLEKLFGILEGTTLSKEERAFVLQNTLSIDDDFLVYHLGKELVLLASSKKEQLNRIAYTFIRLEKAQEGLKIFETLKPQLKNEAFRFAWALLSVSSDQKEQALSWLQTNPALLEPELLDLYFLSLTKDPCPLSLELAKRLYEQAPSVANQSYLAQEFLKGNHISQALDLYRKLAADPSFRSSYRYVLTIAVQKNLAQPEELHKALEIRLLEKQIGKEEKRNIAYLILELVKDKERAKQIFFALAQEPNADEQDIDATLYVSDLAKDKIILKWLIKKAKTKAGEKQIRYLERLRDHGQAQSAFEILEEKLTAPYPKNYLPLYTQIAIQIAKKNLVERALHLAFPYEKDHEILSSYAKIAYDYVSYPLAKNILSGTVPPPK